MFVKVSKNKENFEDKRLKKAPSYEVDDVFKGREFGKELTNNTESTSDSVVDDKTNYSTEEMIYESSVPHMTSKTHKLSDHNNDSSRVKFIKISESKQTLMINKRIINNSIKDKYAD